MHNNKIFAALDLGSNTCRLIIKKYEDHQFVFIDSYAQTIRLAEGLHEQGHLTPWAMDRAMHALKICADKLKVHQPDFFRAVATEACRVASNASVLLAYAQEQLGMHVEIISPREEASLSLRGCEELLNEKKPYAIVFDIGGASTEILFVELQKRKSKMVIHDMLSLPYGVVRISETYGPHMHRVFPDLIHQIREKILQYFDQKRIRSLTRAHKLQLLGCSGTATTIAAMALDLKAYDRRIIDGVRISLDSIVLLAEKIGNVERLAGEAERYTPLGRKDLIEPGLAILQGICQAFPFPSLRVADRGVRDGVIADLAQKHRIVGGSSLEYVYAKNCARKSA